jgi:hypothetical protein
MAPRLFLPLLCLLLLLSFLFAGSVGASSEMWSRTYGNGKETGYSLVETSDGGFAIAGGTGSFGAGGNDFWLVKTDANGNMDWNRTYGGAESESAKALIKTSDGGFAIAGDVHSFDYKECDWWLVKTDRFGNMEWNQTYGGPGYDYANSLVETSDGGYAIGGSFDPDYEDPFGDRYLWIVKTDSYGNMEWNRTYSDSPSNYCSDLLETNDGGYLLAGNTGRYLVEANIWIIKIDEQGNIEWNQRYGGRKHTGANSLVKTWDGGYAVAGSITDSFGHDDFWLVKIDGSGNMRWNQTYGGAGTEKAYSLVKTSDGGYALAGITTGAIGTEAYIDSWMVKTDANGNEIWSQTYGGTGDQYLYSLIETSDGAFALAGWQTSTYAGPPDLWLIKTDKYGNIPEFSSWIILPLFLMATFVGVIAKKRLSQNIRCTK